MKFLPFGGSKTIIGKVLLTSVLFLFSFSLLLAHEKGILEQEITIKFKDLPLSEALNAIAAQADCSFSYSNTLLKSNRAVTASYHKTPLKNVLTDLLGDKLNGISISGSTVLLLAPGGYITGSVWDGNQPIPFATVRLDGTTHGTATKEDGTFRLKVPNTNTWTLVVSAVGHETYRQAFRLNTGETLNMDITLQESMIQMKEVVITADRAIVSTATRTHVPIKDLPMPVMVVEGKQLEMMGSRRLNEVLQEQTGLALTTDPSGASNALGLQVQGFDASYTMIMIDGQPLIGRNSLGILDLSRITVANIDRIEIVKGTSSAM